MKLQGHFVSLFLCTWPRRLGELSASGEADPGWKGLDSGGGGPRRRSCVGANMYAKGEASVEPLTLTHQPHRVIQGTPSWLRVQVGDWRPVIFLANLHMPSLGGGF